MRSAPPRETGRLARCGRRVCSRGTQRALVTDSLVAVPNFSEGRDGADAGCDRGCVRARRRTARPPRGPRSPPRGLLARRRARRGSALSLLAGRARGARADRPAHGRAGSIRTSARRCCPDRLFEPPSAGRAVRRGARDRGRARRGSSACPFSSTGCSPAGAPGRSSGAGGRRALRRGSTPASWRRTSARGGCTPARARRLSPRGRRWWRSTSSSRRRLTFVTARAIAAAIREGARGMRACVRSASSSARAGAQRRSR